MTRYIIFIILLYIITNNLNASCTCPAHLTTERLVGSQYSTDDLAGMLRYLGETCNSCRTAGVNVYAETTCSEPYDVPYDVWESSGGNNYLVTKYKKVTDIKLATVKCICEQPNETFPMPEGNYTEIADLESNDCNDNFAEKNGLCFAAGGEPFHHETKNCCKSFKCLVNNDTQPDTNCTNDEIQLPDGTCETCENNTTATNENNCLPPDLVCEKDVLTCDKCACAKGTIEVLTPFNYDDGSTESAVCSDPSFPFDLPAKLCYSGDSYQDESQDDQNSTDEQNTTCPLNQIFIKDKGCVGIRKNNDNNNTTDDQNTTCPTDFFYSLEKMQCLPFYDQNNTDSNNTNNNGGSGTGDTNGSSGGGGAGDGDSMYTHPGFGDKAIEMIGGYSKSPTLTHNASCNFGSISFMGKQFSTGDKIKEFVDNTSPQMRPVIIFAAVVSAVVLVLVGGI